MDFNLIKELAAPNATNEGAIVLPYMRDNGFVENVAAFAKLNNQWAVNGLGQTKDHDFDFELEKEALAEGLSENNARIFKESSPLSREHALRLRDTFMRSEYLMRSAAEGGWDAKAGLLVGSMADWTMLTGVGASVATLKALNSSRKLAHLADMARKAGATAKEVAVADAAVKGVAGSLAFDAAALGGQMAQGRMDMEEAEDSIAMGLLMTGLIGGPMFMRNLKATTELRETMVKALNEGKNPIRELSTVHEQSAAVRKDADESFNTGDYVKENTTAMKAQAPSRFSMTQDTGVPVVDEYSSKLFQDSTYLRTDEGKNIQAVTADLEADKWTFSVEGELGERLMAGRTMFLKSPEGKAWLKKNGLSMWDRVLSKPLNDRMAYDISRHLSSGGKIDDLPPGLREMAQANDDAVRKTFEQMKRYGVEGTEDLEHVAGHMRRIHDDEAYRRLIHSYGDVAVGQEALTKVMAESIVKGALKEGRGMNADLARRLAMIIQHRVLVPGKDKMALEGFLTNPNTLYKEALAHYGDEAKALQTARDAFGNEKWNPGDKHKRYKKADGGNDTMLKHRIPMDLSVSVPGKTNKWGDEFRVSDLMMTDAFELSHRYVRRGMGNAALAKAGLKSPEAVEEMLSKARQQVAEAADGQKATDAVNRLAEGIRRIQGVGAVEELTGAQAKFATVAAMLGRHATGVGLGGSAIAGFSELARVINRTGFKALADLVPGLRNADDKKLLESFKDFGLYYGNSRMMGYFSHLEDFGSNGFGVAGALASQSAQSALRFSGLSLMDQMTRQSALIGWARSIEKEIVEGKRGMKGFRLSEMGWKPEAKEAISGYIRKHGMDMNEWRLVDGSIDHKAIEAFTSGGHKVVSENVTRMLAGESNAFVDSTLGGVFLQFRKIVYATYNKSLIRGLSQVDAITMSNLVAGFFGALAVNEMRTAVKTAGMSDEDRENYMKKWHLRTALASGGDASQAIVGTLSYTPAGGPLAELLAMFSSMLFGVDLRGRHQSGPQTIFQSPSIQLMENMTRSAGGAITAPFKDEPDYDDMKRRAGAITTLQNWYAVPLITNMLKEN